MLFRSMLMTAKGAARKFTWIEGGLLEGGIVGVSDINFGIDEVRFGRSLRARGEADEGARRLT